MSGVIVGLGSIGNRHLNNLIELGVEQLTVVRRPDSQNRQFHPPENVTISHSLSQTLAAQPDFAVICNPTHLHARAATECLAAGVPVMIEKPLGKSLGVDEQRLIEIAGQSETICAMAYCMRYHPAYRMAYDEVRNESIGRCLYAKAWFEGYLPDWHPWEDYRQSYAGLKEQGGGVLRTLDHELDVMNWVLGPAESATGSAINTGGIGIAADDLAMYQLRHPGGIRSQITTSFCRKPQSRGFEFVGTEGVLCFRMESACLDRFSHADAKPQSLLELSDYDINQMYVDLIKDFVGSCQNGKTSASLPTLQNALHCLSLIETIDEDNICPG